MKRSLLWFCVVLLTLASVFGYVGLTYARTSADPVASAWRSMQQVGVYSFATDVVQTTSPAPKVTNAGKSSRNVTLRIAGAVDTPGGRLNLGIQQSTNGVTPDSTIEVRVTDDVIEGRNNDGAWQRIDAYPDVLGQTNDPLAFLAAARGITSVSDGATVAGSVAHYQFMLDGEAFSAHMRAQIERMLKQRSTLPAGISVQTADQYRDISGQGEVWLDADGLPLHMTTRLDLPTQPNGEAVKAQFTTVFDGIAHERLAEAWYSPTALASLMGMPRSAHAWAELSLDLLLLAVVVLLVVVVIAAARSRRLQVALALLVIAIMPMQHVSQAYAADRAIAQVVTHNAAQQGLARSTQLGEQAARDMQQMDREPTQNPLTAPLPPTANPAAVENPTGDDDGDTLTNLQEARLGTNPKSDDSDNDGITDGIEALRFTAPGDFKMY